MDDHALASRRRFLHQSTRLATAAGMAGAALPLVAGRPARAATPARTLNLAHTHTGERLSLLHAAGDALPPAATAALNHFLRDHYSGAAAVIDLRLLELLHGVQRLLRLDRGTAGVFEIISAYRAPDTNARLRERGGGGVARASLHMQGRALDVRLRGVPLPELRDAALELRAGGVGFYARDRFVHLDTGRVRSW